MMPLTERDARALKKFVRRCKCLRKFPNGRVYYGRGKADEKQDTLALVRIRHRSLEIGLESRRLVAVCLWNERVKRLSQQQGAA